MEKESDIGFEKPAAKPATPTMAISQAARKIGQRR
jgi:hypothetical protein